MRLSAPALVLASTVTAGLPFQTPASDLDRARRSVETLAEEHGAEVAVVWQPLDEADPERGLRLNPTRRFHAASMMKVPVMVELFRQVELGRVSLEDTLVVTNRFRSIVDGSPYELDASEDSDGEIYRAIGRPLTYRALCEAMITVSSNLAANLLIDRLDPAVIRRTTAGLGAAGLEVLRGVEDQKAFDQGLSNSTDAGSLATLFRKIGRGEAVSRDASAAMVDILARQHFTEGIPAGLPAGIRVAHKTGSITRIRHDGGIVYASRPYVLVVLTRGLDDGDEADALIAAVARIVHPLAR